MFTKASAASVALVVGLLLDSTPLLAQATGCTPPLRPFVPSALRDVQVYADLIRQDFEAYIVEFEAYLRCLDAERTRVFAEGQEVIREYGRFQELVQSSGPR